MVSEEQRLVSVQNLLNNEKIEIFRTPDGNIYATIPVKGHKENWPVKSDRFKQWLSYKRSESGMDFFPLKKWDIDAIEGRGHFDSPQKPIFTRLAEFDGKIYLDLANEKWEVVEISKEGWNIIADPPVKFRRTMGMLPLPCLVHGGSLEDLRPFVSISSEKDWILFVSWLIGALQPTGPYPILVILGIQGTGKSCMSRRARSIIDPSAAPLQAIPRDERDLLITATNSRLICFDNISNLPTWLQNLLCRVSTGGGNSFKKNYTDDEEVFFNVKRPIILNGINNIVTRHDLADRAIIINLSPISQENRKLEREIEEDFRRALPKILGALCDAIKTGLKNYSHTKLKQLPRMADFAQWVCAAEPSLPWSKGKFLEAYTGNRKEIIESALENDLLANVVSALIEEEVVWEGTATDLLEKLEKYTSEKVRESRCWPKQANVLSKELKRIEAFLLEVGISIDFQTQTRPKKIRIEKVNKIPEDVATMAVNNLGRKQVVSMPEEHVVN